MENMSKFQSSVLALKLKVHNDIADCFYQGHIMASFSSDAESSADLIRQSPTVYPIAEDEVVVIFKPVKVLRSKLISSSQVVIEDWNK